MCWLTHDWPLHLIEGYLKKRILCKSQRLFLQYLAELWAGIWEQCKGFLARYSPWNVNNHSPLRNLNKSG